MAGLDTDDIMTHAHAWWIHKATNTLLEYCNGNSN